MVPLRGGIGNCSFLSPKVQDLPCGIPPPGLRVHGGSSELQARNAAGTGPSGMKRSAGFCDFRLTIDGPALPGAVGRTILSTDSAERTG
jgi:hypothetical protein